MCGIVGSLTRTLPEPAVLERACAALTHRGPDAAGVWTDATTGIALGHRRLSIIDLSPAGAQPMTSSSGRYVIAYNGEIYNHLELREALDGPWRGHSDTETLLAAVETWGVEQTLTRIVGMFAFALWDRERKRLVLARDRFGEKPLYYGLVDHGLLFASELDALRAYPSFRPSIDRGALALYTHYNSVPGAHCIYEGFRKLMPGTWIEVVPGLTTLPEPTVYWSAYKHAHSGRDAPLDLAPEEAADQLDAVIRRSVKGQMISDVPLGALLSGGIDSSLVVSLMQAQSSRPVKTFSIGFHEAVYNEAAHAAAVAKHLGTDHTELYVTPGDALEVIPHLPTMYSEPFGDSSQVPTHLVSKLAREHVTVALSGDGGDELFGGYNRYFLATSLWRKTRYLPAPVRHAAAAAISALPPRAWDRVAGAFNPLLPRRLRLSLAGDKLHKGADVMGSDSGEALYGKLVSFWGIDELVQGASPTLPYRFTDLPTLSEQMMALDAVGYLPDDILTKVDRASMAVSLETRVPLLDHRVYEFAWRLPLDYKIRDGEGKWLLRKLLYRYVPRELIERPKMGFGVPIDQWLRGPLKAWAEDLLTEERLKRDGHFDPAPIRRRWAEHQSGRRNWQYHLWGVLMFQAWRDVHS